MTDFKATAHAASMRSAPEKSRAPSNFYRFVCTEHDRAAQYSHCQAHIDFVVRGKTGYTHPGCVEAVQNGTCPALKMQQAEQDAGIALFENPEPGTEWYRGMDKVPRTIWHPVFDLTTGEPQSGAQGKLTVRNWPIRKGDSERRMRDAGQKPASGGVEPSGDGKGLYNEVMERDPLIKPGERLPATAPKVSNKKARAKPGSKTNVKPVAKDSDDDDFLAGSDSMMADAVNKAAARENTDAEASETPAERPKKSKGTTSARKTQSPPSDAQKPGTGMSLLERARAMRQGA